MSLRMQSETVCDSGTERERERECKWRARICYIYADYLTIVIFQFVANNNGQMGDKTWIRKKKISKWNEEKPGKCASIQEMFICFQMNWTQHTSYDQLNEMEWKRMRTTTTTTTTHNNNSPNKHMQTIHCSKLACVVWNFLFCVTLCLPMNIVQWTYEH